MQGVPVAVKDVIFTQNVRTTMGSKLYHNFVPDYDSTVVRKLKEAGAIVIGKTHTHEFAFGPTGDRSFFGPCRNPYDPNKISGGSISGSAAAVALDMVSVAIGTDTGGSVSIPASICGVIGLKPTFGLLSKYGIYNTAFSLDHPGVISQTVKDNAVLLNILVGHDSNDPDSIVKSEEDYTSLLGKSIKGKAIGLPTHFYQNIDPEVEKTMHNVMDVYTDLGVKLVWVELEEVEEIASYQRMIIQAEAFAIHEKNLSVRSLDYDQELYERLQTGKTVPAYQYVLAQKRRKELTHGFNKIFEKVDVLLTPTIPIAPVDLDQREVQINEHCESVRDALLRLTSPLNYTGNPVLSIPGGKNAAGLPIGF